MGAVVGIVLGAGEAERMGEPKQLLPYAGTTILGKTIAEAEASRLDRVIVVLGASAARVEASLGLSRAEVVQNPDYKTGNLGSLRVGVRAAGDHDAVVHLLGDMPDVDAALIDDIVGTWKSDPRPIAIARYRDLRAHPIVLAASTVSGLDQLSEPRAIWRLIESTEPHDVLEVRIDREAPIDVDTPADYQRLLGSSG